jgi:hypothetical protein
MKIEVVTFVNATVKDARKYKKCIDSQREWAELHGMTYRIFEYSSDDYLKNDWEFYINYFNMDKEDDTYYLGILPTVMILNKHENPFKDIEWDGILVNSATYPSFYFSKKVEDQMLQKTIQHSMLFKDTPSSTPMLGLRIIICKTIDYVIEHDDVHIGMPYVQGLSSGMEMHLDTNKEGLVEVSYSPRLLDDEQFFQPGDFAVNIPFGSAFGREYIRQFLFVKKQIDRIMKLGKSLEKDLSNEKSNLGS